MRKRTILVVLLISLVAAAAAPVQAEDRRRDESAAPALGIVDSAGRAALRMELQPTTQRVVRGRPTLFWVGIATMAGGGALAALSGSVFAKKYRFGGGHLGYQETQTNKGVLYGGGGLIAAGTMLALMNRTHQRQAATTFAPSRGGVAIFRTLTF